MNIKEIREKAKNDIKVNWQPIFVGFILTSVALGVVGATGIGIIFMGPIMVGFSIYLLKVLRKKEFKTENLLDGFKNCFENSLVAGILMAVFTFLWSLLFVIPGIVKAISYSMTPYILADNPKLTASEAIDKSQEMMNGHKWEYFCMMLGFLGWIILSIFTFGILYVLYVGPYMKASEGHFYNKLSGKKDKTIALDFDPDKY